VNRAKEAWADISVQLKRRYDLIPNLGRDREGLCRTREKRLRAGDRGARCCDDRASACGQAQAENMLTGALKSLFAVSEAYPDLKANQNFLELQRESGRYGRQDPGRAPLLQLHGARPQHRDAVVSGESHRLNLPLRKDAALRAHRCGCGSARAGESELLTHFNLNARSSMAMPSLIEERASNLRRTWILMAVFLVLVVAIGYAISWYYNSSLILYVAVAFALGMNVWAYWNSDKQVLSMTNARPATREEFFDFYTVTENLAITAGMQVPKLYVIEDPAPNAFSTGRDEKHAVVCATTGLAFHDDARRTRGRYRARALACA
jgi:hypothetical protein